MERPFFWARCTVALSQTEDWNHLAPSDRKEGKKREKKHEENRGTVTSMWWSEINSFGSTVWACLLTSDNSPSSVYNCFIPFMGSLGFLLEPIPAVSGWRQGTPWTSRQLIAGPQFGVQHLVQGHLLGFELATFVYIRLMYSTHQQHQD